MTNRNEHFHGERGVLAISLDGEQVQCHICGRWFKHLGIHVVNGHQWSCADYREEFGLNRSTGLVAPETARKMYEATRKNLMRWEHRPDFLYIEKGTRFEARLEQRLHQRAAVRHYAQIERITIACERCGVSVETPAYRRRNRKYCDICAPIVRRQQSKEWHCRKRGK